MMDLIMGVVTVSLVLGGVLGSFITVFLRHSKSIEDGAAGSDSMLISDP